ncbi:DsbA family protein [Streptomyces sp. YC504]|uniref:DsbA family protein n=1 Tax=Streptomyces mesophilus TaxID=1775132 RepID=A0A6G4XEY0_9ACTN|nr:DsbA family protein [Streptomyces mesophilus]NGO76095.1 DsbA family protein [Streptomyces mesophilus]
MSKTDTTATAQPAAKRRGPAIGAGVVAAALLFGWFSYTATKPEAASGPSGRDAVADVSTPESAPEQDDTYTQLAKLARRDAKDPLAQGRADAPVVMIEYADFKCGFCGKFARDTEPELVKKYVDAGKLRIEWRNFPIFGEESEAAARGAWAAGQQGRFWEFHAAAYEEDAKEKGFGADRLKALAEQAGVADVDRFVRDAASGEARKAVARDQEEAYGLGAASTPSFLVNGRPIAGAQPAETFTQAIDEALTAAARDPK